MEEKNNTEVLLKSIISGIQEKKGNNIVSLNLAKLQSSLCDYFVICDAESTTQVDAIANSIEEKVFENLHQKAWKKNGYENAQWILIDYYDVVVHIFQKEYREYYKLQELWADAPIKHYDFE